MPHPPLTPPEAVYAIRPRRNTWDALRKQTDLTSDAALAGKLHVAETTAYRVMSGATEPSTKFIAQALYAFPFATFDRLFEVYAKPATR